MVGFYDAPLGGGAGLERQGTYAVPSTTGEVLGASVRGGFEHAFPTADITRMIDESGAGIRPPPSAAWAPAADSRIAGDLAARDAETPPPRLLTPDEANERYGIKGRLSWSAPVYEDVAREQLARKRETIAREDIIARREHGLLTGGVARIGAGLVGGLPGIVDPLNIASAFVPVVGEARAAAWAARYGFAGVAARGAVEGMAGQALLTPLQYGISVYDQEDFGAVDALLNIALGGVFGGGLHTGLHVLGRRAPDIEAGIEAAPPETREALLRGAVADLAEGRPVETARTIEMPPPDYGYIRQGDGDATPYERVPREPQRLASFLRSEGGLIDEGTELSSRGYNRGHPGLVNRNGMSLDDATHAAWEAGYLPNDPETGGRPRIDALLDALDRDLREGPVYSERDLEAAREFREARDRNTEIDRLAGELGLPTRGITREEFFRRIGERGDTETAGAIEGVPAAGAAASGTATVASRDADFPPAAAERLEQASGPQPGAGHLIVEEMIADLPAALRGGSIDIKRFARAPDPEAVDQLIEWGHAWEAREIDRIFGRDAAEARRLMRSRQAADYEALEKLTEKYGPEGEGIVYGMHGRAIVDIDELRRLANELADIDGAVKDAASAGDLEMLGRELSWTARDLPPLEKSAEAHSTEERLAVLKLARAFDDMHAAGLDVEAVFRQATRYTLERVSGDASDAQELLRNIASYAREYGRDRPTAQPPRPTAQIAGDIVRLLGPERTEAETGRLSDEHAALMRQAADDGWLPDFDTPDTPEGIADAYRQELAARRAAESAYGIDGPATDAGTAGADEAGARSGGRGAGAGRGAAAAELAADPDGRAFGDPADLAPELTDPAAGKTSEQQLAALAEETDAILRDLQSHLPDGADSPVPGLDPGIRAAEALIADLEASARAIEQGGICLGRRA
ncbi:MAG: hypothetical protein AB7H90_02905 [Alphaproteobacteria bacterium]